MKKIFTFMFSIVCAGAMAQGTQKLIPDAYLYGVPSAFSYNGQTVLYYSDYNEESHWRDGDMTIFDEDFNVKKQIQVPTVTCEEYTEVRRLDPATGEWTVSREDVKTMAKGPLYIYSNDWRTSYSGLSSFCLTQTLFNQDEDYEYVLPVVRPLAVFTAESDTDGDGVIDKVDTYYSARAVGFRVVSETGETIQEVLFDNGFSCLYDMSTQAYLIGDKCYLSFPGSVFGVNEMKTFNLVYQVDRITTAIEKVPVQLNMRVTPTVADRREMITVELDETDEAVREVQVVNAAGQVVARVPVMAGQRQVSVPASELSRGVNVVNVVGGKGSNSCKVIVK